MHELNPCLIFPQMSFIVAKKNCGFFFGGGGTSCLVSFSLWMLHKEVLWTSGYGEPAVFLPFFCIWDTFPKEWLIGESPEVQILLQTRCVAKALPEAIELTSLGLKSFEIFPLLRFPELLAFIFSILNLLTRTASAKSPNWNLKFIKSECMCFQLICMVYFSQNNGD